MKAAGAKPSVVISEHVWESYFHRDPGVAGRYLRIEAQWYRIVGVAPKRFRGTFPPLLVDAWLPLVTYPIFRPQLTDTRAAGPAVTLAGRLAPGETVEHAS